MVFKNGVEKIKAAAYNGARTVIEIELNPNLVQFQANLT